MAGIPPFKSEAVEMEERWKILEEFLQIYSGIKYCILVLVDKEKEGRERK